ncbi:hypothetical protein IscW_ISCW023991 [Ixodes scapularis]|uniref:Uncharacterized protein n=1 Tax=Ixodes scapularis TaxID=6945 RepID=B7QMP1_IXOSC|nr:hypothetical protein IscW_ISCW023991 [Ixodes scapularis]|eukprot:XP_002400024.1 hypothetical protein IscW_ISCW023991 [Ixodes scapularis]
MSRRPWKTCSIQTSRSLSTKTQRLLTTSTRNPEFDRADQLFRGSHYALQIPKHRQRRRGTQSGSGAPQPMSASASFHFCTSSRSVLCSSMSQLCTYIARVRAF